MIVSCSKTLHGGLLTPSGYGGIAILRVSGYEALNLISSIFVSSNKLSANDMHSRHIYLGEIWEADQVIDQVMLVCDRERSFFEIHCHGGPRIVQRLLMLLENRGVEIISWMDMNIEPSVSAEVSYFLSNCKSELAVKAIATQNGDGLSSWCERTLDYINSGNAELIEVKSQIKQLITTWELANLLLFPPKVFIVGPPNAGKSSLANALTGRSQSLVSDIPGTTRDWTSEFTEMAGIAVELVDTAGRRETYDHFESVSLKRLTDIISHASLFILLIPADYAGNIEHLYHEQIEAIPVNSRLITIISKSDLLTCSNMADFADILVSTVTEAGIILLKDLVADRLGFGPEFDWKQPLIFSERQYNLINKLVNCGNIEDVKTTLTEIKGS